MFEISKSNMLLLLDIITIPSSVLAYDKTATFLISHQGWNYWKSCSVKLMHLSFMVGIAVPLTYFLPISAYLNDTLEFSTLDDC
jgi:hypothetical protein